MAQEKWREGVEKLQEDDITMVEVYQSFIDDTMMLYPKVTMPEARVIVRNAINRAVIGRMIRQEIDYFMIHGEFWKE